MQFDYEAHSAKLELRIMELEDTTKAMVEVLKTMNQMLSSLGEMVNQWALMTMPSVFGKLLSVEDSAPAPASSAGNGGGTGFFCGVNHRDLPNRTTPKTT